MKKNKSIINFSSEKKLILLRHVIIIFFPLDKSFVEEVKKKCVPLLSEFMEMICVSFNIISSIIHIRLGPEKLEQKLSLKKITQGILSQ